MSKTQSTGAVPIKDISQKATQVEVNLLETKSLFEAKLSTIETKSSPVVASAVSNGNSDTTPAEAKLVTPIISSPSIKIESMLPYPTTGPSAQIILNENLLADKLASPPKDIRQDESPRKIAETSKGEQPGGMFHRLRDFFGLTGTETEIKAKHSEPSSASSPNVYSGTQASAHTPEIPKSSILSPLLSAEETVVSSPSSLRQLTPPIPESESLYSATNFAPPTINTFIGTSHTRGQILSLPNFSKVALFPSTIPKTSHSLQDHYTRQVRIHKPEGMSDYEIRQILSGWLKIESWSTEELNETSMRRVVRMTLSSAFEIMEVRKREQQIRQEERSAMQSKRDNGEEKAWYPLTEHTIQGGDRKGETGKSEKKIKEKGDTTIVKLEDGKSDHSKQLAGTKSENSKLEVTGIQKSAETQPFMSTDFRSNKVESCSVPAEQIPPLHGANPWTVRQKVQAEENRAISN